jgi:hypothetical protein
MENYSSHLENIISEYSKILHQIDEPTYQAKPYSDKWSKIEILGHLVDSAQNNIRRFIVAQYEESPKIVYQQDDWVRINDYEHYPKDDLVNLWTLLNKQICQVLKNTGSHNMQRTCLTPAPHTIEWLASDYIKHLLHHLHQIADKAPVPYP